MGKQSLLFTILTMTSLVTTVYSIVGYDCASSRLNITTLSLLEVGECNLPKHEVNSTETYVQLIQFSGVANIKVVQCKVEVKRSIFYCGMHSHSSAVRNGYAEYLQEITHETCKSLHTTGVYKYSDNLIISNLKVNSTGNKHSVTFAGRLKDNGDCSGTSFVDPFGSWENVIVLGIITIKLTVQEASVDLNTDKIRLTSGVICPLSQTTCIDEDNGYSFWDPLPRDICHFRKYEVLYEGVATKIQDPNSEETLYSFISQDLTFVLAQTGQFALCQYVLIRTEHPKLFIFPTKQGRTFLTQNTVSIQNLDIFTYVNSKFIYVERHVRTEMNRLYHDVMYQRCTLEREVFKNSLILATQAPDEFALHLMKGPGYMSIIAGEVVHIVKCVPVELIHRKVKECYLQLPVLKGNESLFLSPRTHILTSTGTQTDCNAFVPSMYRIGESWYKISPYPIESLPPEIMKPLTQPTWKYTNPASLATSGIYSQTDLERLRDHIMFPAERPMLLNTLARGMMGQSVAHQGMSILNLMDEQTLDKIAASAWGRFWTIFTSFGTASAGIIGIFILFRIIKLIADTFIHGYALHSMFGWSFRLLGAFWDSVTNLLLHLSHASRDNPCEHETAPPNCPPPTPEPKPTEINLPGNFNNQQIRQIYPNPHIDNSYIVHV